MSWWDVKQYLINQPLIILASNTQNIAVRNWYKMAHPTLFSSIVLPWKDHLEWAAASAWNLTMSMKEYRPWFHADIRFVGCACKQYSTAIHTKPKATFHVLPVERMCPDQITPRNLLPILKYSRRSTTYPTRYQWNPPVVFIAVSRLHLFA